LRSSVPCCVGLARVIGILSCLLVVTACGSAGDAKDAAGSSGEGEQVRTLTKEQALQRAKEHVKKVVAALPVEPSLSKQSGGSMECADPSDNGPRGRYTVDRTYWLNDLPKDRNAEFVNTLYRYWKNNNYRILTDERARDDSFISVEHNGDAFRMSVTQSDEGNLSLGASSPCVWPDGVPPSSTEE